MNLILAFGEKLIISSRNGLCLVDKDENFYLWDDNNLVKSNLMGNDMFIDGTLLALRINTNKFKNIYDYTKRRKYDKSMVGDFSEH